MQGYSVLIFLIRAVQEVGEIVVIVSDALEEEGGFKGTVSGESVSTETIGVFLTSDFTSVKQVRGNSLSLNYIPMVAVDIQSPDTITLM
jgi:hypothetical protein